MKDAAPEVAAAEPSRRCTRRRLADIEVRFVGPEEEPAEVTARRAAEAGAFFLALGRGEIGAAP